MPDYKCVNIGIEGYPVWLTLSEKATIAIIEPATYPDKVECLGASKALVTTVSFVVDGCCVEAKTPASIESVCRILGFMWDEKDLAAKSAIPEAVDPVASEDEKTEGGGLQ